MHGNYNQISRNRKRRKPSLLTQWYKQIIEIDGLTTSERYVLFVISTYFNNKTLECYPSQRRIAEKAGVDKKTVNSAVHKASGLGLLRIGTAENIPKENRRHKQLCWYKATFPEYPE